MKNQFSADMGRRGGKVAVGIAQLTGMIWPYAPTWLIGSLDFYLNKSPLL